MKLFDFIDASDNDEESRQRLYILEFFQFVQPKRDPKCLFQFCYEYDPYGWSDPLFASGFSILEYSAFYIYFKCRRSVVNFFILTDSRNRWKNESQRPD